MLLLKPSGQHPEVFPESAREEQQRCYCGNLFSFVGITRAIRAVAKTDQKLPDDKKWSDIAKSCHSSIHAIEGNT